jgi:hypothetical protein
MFFAPRKTSAPAECYRAFRRAVNRKVEVIPRPALLGGQKTIQRTAERTAFPNMSIDRPSTRSVNDKCTGSPEFSPYWPLGVRSTRLHSIISEERSCLPMFLQIRHAANSGKPNGLRPPTSCLADTHEIRSNVRNTPYRESMNDRGHEPHFHGALR